ncbi:MAG: YdcF family protein [Deltaproteobacteria bacterium]|nr:YdcF family protein [Deltaproteobacteria bacterium]
MFPFDGVLILGKELRADPVRARAELRARAAAAAAAARAGAGVVATLEARLRGQDRSGSDLVSDMLAELDVPPEKLVARSQTRSTREEAALGAAFFLERGCRRGLVLTASYHVPRARRLFAEAGAPAEVHAPDAMWRWANERERTWIAAGRPGGAALAREARIEQALRSLEAVLRPLPVATRTMLEVAAGVLWRGSA